MAFSENGSTATMVFAAETKSSRLLEVFLLSTQHSALSTSLLGINASNRVS
jgi:hypothetical protein